MQMFLINYLPDYFPGNGIRHKFYLVSHLKKPPIIALPGPSPHPGKAAWNSTAPTVGITAQLIS
jgi:hypothetical protein